MTNCAVWLDSEKAYVFNLKSSGVEKSHLEMKVRDHHTHNKKDHHEDPAPEHFFHELAQKLAHANEILILGPGVAKTHFKSHLEVHHPTGLDKKVVGVESCDHPTDNQIVAYSKRFFKAHNLFEAQTA